MDTVSNIMIDLINGSTRSSWIGSGFLLKKLSTTQNPCNMSRERESEAGGSWEVATGTNVRPSAKYKRKADVRNELYSF